MKKIMALVLVLILALGTCLAEENIRKNGTATENAAQETPEFNEPDTAACNEIPAQNGRVAGKGWLLHPINKIVR